MATDMTELESATLALKAKLIEIARYCNEQYLIIAESGGAHLAPAWLMIRSERIGSLISAFVNLHSGADETRDQRERALRRWELYQLLDASPVWHEIAAELQTLNAISAPIDPAHPLGRCKHPDEIYDSKGKFLP